MLSLHRVKDPTPISVVHLKETLNGGERGVQVPLVRDFKVGMLRLNSETKVRASVSLLGVVPARLVVLGDSISGV